MNTPQDRDKLLLTAGGSAAVLIRNKNKIARLFDERVRNTLLPVAESYPMIINTLPEFLTDLALALSTIDRRTFASEYSNVPTVHGTLRARLTSFSLRQVVKEYQILREIVTEILIAEASLSLNEWAIVHKSIDEAIGDATSAFVQVHHEIREQFMATLTHDLRNPLSAAKTSMQMIVLDNDRPQQHSVFAAKAIDNIDRIDRMIQDLLDATRARAGERIPLQPSQCDLQNMIRNALDEFTEKEGHRFVFEADQPVQAYCDCEKIRRAFVNLAQNAIKYGTPKTLVTVRLLETHERVHISVHNFGNPIPPQEQATLFRAYRRSPSAQHNRKEGWGLGLALVKSISEAHGGAVILESSSEQGTTFTLDILKDIRTLKDQPKNISDLSKV